MIVLVHAAIMVAAAGVVARRLAADRLRRFLVAVVLIEALLVATAEILSACGALGSLPAHAAVSLTLTAALVLVTRRLRPVDAPADSLDADPDARWTRPLFAVAAVAAALTAFVSLTAHPNNPDAVQAYLPRIVFARDQGHLGAVPSGDFRMSFTPTNGTALSVYVLLYTSSDALFPLVNLAAWFALAAAVVVLARECGARPAAAWLAAFTAVLTASALMQAGSTNLDILATASLVAAIALAASAWRTGALRFALLSGVALGLSIGTKPSVYFFAPAVVLAAMTLPFARPRLRALGLFAVAVLLFGSSWIVRNVRDLGSASPRHEDLDAGRWMQEGFSASRMLRGTSLHLAQHLLQPVAALWPDIRQGQDALTRALKPDAWLPVKAPPGARFDFEFGFAPICEDTAWFGFAGALVWLPAVLSGLLLYAHRSLPWFLLSAAALLWIFFYYGKAHWYPHNGRYTLMPYAVACAGVGIALTRLPRWIPAAALVLTLSAALDTLQATVRNHRRNVRKAVANVQAGERRHFLSRGNDNMLRDLSALAEGLRDVVYFEYNDYGRPFATMTTLGFDRRYVYRKITSPQADALLALPYHFTALYTPRDPACAGGFVLPAQEEATAYFAVPRGAPVAHPFVWIRPGLCLGATGRLRYDFISGGVEFDEDGDGNPETRLVLDAPRMSFDGGYPSPVSLDLPLTRLRSRPTLDAWLARGRSMTSDAPFDFRVLARRHPDGPWITLAAAEAVFTCDPASMTGAYDALSPGTWCVAFGVMRADSPNRALDVPNNFDDYVLFDIRLMP